MPNRITSYTPTTYTPKQRSPRALPRLKRKRKKTGARITRLTSKRR